MKVVLKVVIDDFDFTRVQVLIFQMVRNKVKFTVKYYYVPNVTFNLSPFMNDHL